MDEPAGPRTVELGTAVTEPAGPTPADRPGAGPGGAAGPAGPPPRRRRGWVGALREHSAFVIVLAVAAVGIERIVLYHWREGGALLGAALLLAAGFRALLPERRTGLLAVRGRLVDVLSYGGLGGLVLFIAFTITGGPFG
jgi:hypothetical protein